MRPAPGSGALHPHREFDVVVYGASGFTGRHVLAYLARHQDMPGLRVGVAGRDARRLHDAMAQVPGALATATVLVADSRDQASVDAMTARARIVLNVAGPFALLGGPVVDACVRTGTHYVDIAGEPIWIREMIDRHDQRAAAAGTRIIPCCGFDSVPSDLGALLLVEHARRTWGLGCSGIAAYYTLRGGLNGGTVASYLNQRMSRGPRRPRDPFLLNPEGPPAGRDASRDRDPAGVTYDEDIGGWVGPFVMGPVNTRVVRRSAALYARWQDPYGPDFHYQEYARYSPPLGRAKATLVTAGLGAFHWASGRALTRRLLTAVLPAPGQGPSSRSMARGWFCADFIGRGADGRMLRGRISDRGDPSNHVTAKCVVESALALALQADVLPGGDERGGVLTPATGLGAVLGKRLARAGMIVECGRR
jgi:short subunit dehydrogenase-like uncharacterized protein